MNISLHHTSTANYYFPNDFTNKRAFPSPKGTDGVWGPHTSVFNGYWIPSLRESDSWIKWRLCLLLRLRMCGVIRPFAFMVCAGTKRSYFTM